MPVLCDELYAGFTFRFKRSISINGNAGSPLYCIRLFIERRQRKRASWIVKCLPNNSCNIMKRTKNPFSRIIAALSYSHLVKVSCHSSNTRIHLPFVLIVLRFGLQNIKILNEKKAAIEHPATIQPFQIAITQLWIEMVLSGDYSYISSCCSVHAIHYDFCCYSRSPHAQ